MTFFEINFDLGFSHKS